VPVYDQGYQTYGGERKSLKMRWFPLWREEVLPFLKKRIFIFLLVISLMPWLVFGVGLSLLRTQITEGHALFQFIQGFPRVDETWVAWLLTNFWNTFMLVILAIWVGAPLVARDRKQHTLEVFLGRALGPVQYLWAKGAALGLFFLVFSLMPILFLFVCHLGLSGDWSFLWQHSRILWGGLLYTLLGPGALILFLLALSSMSRSPRMVGAAFIGFVFFGPAVSGILYAITRSSWVWLISLFPHLQNLGIVCLGAQPGPFLRGLPGVQTFVFFGLMILFSLGVLIVRFRDRSILR